MASRKRTHRRITVRLSRYGRAASIAAKTANFLETVCARGCAMTSPTAERRRCVCPSRCFDGCCFAQRAQGQSLAAASLWARPAAARACVRRLPSRFFRSPRRHFRSLAHIVVIVLAQQALDFFRGIFLISSRTGSRSRTLAIRARAEVLRSRGRSLLPIGLDRERGLEPGNFRMHSHCFLHPVASIPTGAILSLPRRLGWFDWGHLRTRSSSRE